jgi:hypothetical protein
MYKTPEVFNKDMHGQLTYATQNDYAYAKAQTAVPLLSEEVAEASAYYPIVFATDGSARPLALLGLKEQNLYLDAGNRWTAEYIPAFIRRYPFVFGHGTENTQQLHLAIDRSAPHFAGQGDPLFTPEGEPSAVATNAMSFLTQYQAASQRTEAAHQPLLEAGVLVAKDLNQQIGDQTHMIGGFSVIDQRKLNALSDETLARWARSGLLATVYAHWTSLRHLQKLVIAASRPASSN